MQGPAVIAQQPGSKSSVKGQIGAVTDRNSLRSAKIESLQVQKDWLRCGIVKSSLKDIEKHVAEYDKKRPPQVAVSPPSTPFSQ
jgi:hypothetical protein